MWAGEKQCVVEKPVNPKCRLRVECVGNRQDNNNYYYSTTVAVVRPLHDSYYYHVIRAYSKMIRVASIQHTQRAHQAPVLQEEDTCPSLATPYCLPPRSAPGAPTTGGAGGEKSGGGSKSGSLACCVAGAPPGRVVNSTVYYPPLNCFLQASTMIVTFLKSEEPETRDGMIGKIRKFVRQW